MSASHATTASPFKVGDVMRVGRPCLGNQADSLAIVVEVYDLGDGPSPSLLFPNGNHDGFSDRDLDIFRVRFDRHEPRMAGYEFKNAVALYQDWRGGVFQCVWPEHAIAGRQGGGR